MKYLRIISFICFFASFTLPGTISLWKELHQSTAALAGALFLFLSTRNNCPIKITTPLILSATLILTILIDYLLRDNNYHSFYIAAIIYLSCAIFTYMGIKRIEKEKSLNFFCAILVSVCTFSLVAQIYQASGLSHTLYPWVYQMDISMNSRPYANLGQPNILATLYVTSLCLLLWAYKEKCTNKLSIIIFGILISSGIALTQSRTAYLSLLTISALSIVFSKDFFTKIYIPTITTSTFFFKFFWSSTHSIDRAIQENLNNGRFDLWATAFESISKRPFFGYGFNESGRAWIESIDNSKVQNVLATQMHNVFIDLIVWFGLIVGIIFTTMMIYYSIKIWNACIRANYIYPALTLIPYAIHSNLEYPLYYANSLMIFFMALGLTSIYLPQGTIFTTKYNIPEKTSLLIYPLSIICLIFSYQLFSLEKKTIENFKFSIGLTNTRPTGYDQYLLPDFTRDFLKLTSTSEDSWNEELIKDAKKVSMYIASPVLYLSILKWEQNHLQSDYEFWRNKYKKIMDKETISIVEKEFPHYLTE